jgi:hypothetical protein
LRKLHQPTAFGDAHRETNCPVAVGRHSCQPRQSSGAIVEGIVLIEEKILSQNAGDVAPERCDVCVLEYRHEHIAPAPGAERDLVDSYDGPRRRPRGGHQCSSGGRRQRELPSDFGRNGRGVRPGVEHQSVFVAVDRGVYFDQAVGLDVKADALIRRSRHTGDCQHQIQKHRRESSLNRHGIPPAATLRAGRGPCREASVMVPRDSMMFAVVRVMGL